jgi:tRNA threonylcarbamoyladenosine biosynthesis protein TsaE
VVSLIGDLGAGKTAFVRGMVQGMGGEAAMVSSPTFAIVQEYCTPVPLFHADLYRLEAREIPDLGLEELAAKGVLVIEWGDRMRTTPRDAIAVRIADRGGDVRELALDVPDPAQREGLAMALGDPTPPGSWAPLS